MAIAILLALAAAPSPDFDTDVLPVLTRAGCNTGACHGAAAGRGGFRLSLFGGDPAFDHRSVALELQGRRVNIAEPAESLLILKPTATLHHGGGPRLDAEGEGGAILRAWVAAGAVRSSARRLIGLTVTPGSHVAGRTGEAVPLRAVARFDDGSERDVTRWTVFTPDDPAGVGVSDDPPSLTILRPGRHVVVARYIDRVVPVELIVPLSDRPPQPSGDEIADGFIDRHVAERLAQLGLSASPPADDTTFLRRVTLDLTGRLPTPNEVRSFRDDPGGAKREKLIDRLIGSDAFTDYWTYRFAELLRIRAAGPGDPGVAVYHRWLRDRIAEGTPYDRMARELLTATGDGHRSGPPNFHRTTAGPREQAEFVSELFLGIRLRCANCHNHPLDRWTQDDYHGLAAVFATLERGRVVGTGGRGEVIHPLTGEPAVPRIPGGRTLDATPDGRDALADWLTRPENPYFARAIVNRLWKAMMGRGLVEPADDLRQTNPATHPELLRMLAEDFAAHGHDIRHTLRAIARSRAYGRGGPLPENRADDRFYSHSLARPLGPEVLADAIADVTGVPGRYGDHPPGTRAVSLADPATPSQTLDVLGRCPRQDSCESAVGGVGGLTRALHLYNGPLLNGRIADPNGRLARQLAAGEPPARVVSGFYLRALGREPSAAEARFWGGELARAGGDAERAEILEDFLWGLLNCREFVNNH